MTRMIEKAAAARNPAEIVTLETPRAASVSGKRKGEAGRIPSEVQALKQRDNHTNFAYLAGVYLIIAAAMAGAIGVSAAAAAGLVAWWLTIPATIAAIIVIGASQHQLGGAVHEGTHHTFLENRTWGELASDWLAAFPIYTTTYAFRQHHLAHHQFVNDPVRDPDVAQMHDSGHELDFPLTHIEMVKQMARQLWLPNLVRYTFVRARYSSLGADNNPYADPEAQGSKWPNRIVMIFAGLVPVIVSALLHRVSGAAALAFLAVSWGSALGYYLRAPEGHFTGSRLKPVVSHRATYAGRVTFFTGLYATLSAIELAGFGAAWAWFSLLWIVPLFTSFPLFMILRQWVQHGNGDRGRYTNTRVFLVGPLVRYAVFPWGMDYHLPHHLISSVPHYNLKKLHELMLQDAEYAEKGVIVEGYFGGDNPETGRPTAMSVLGPAHAPKSGGEHFVNDGALEHVEVKGAAELARQSELSRMAA
ncbi:MAG: fatty acid desaturase family protein [Hyphomicrobium sp.]